MAQRLRDNCESASDYVYHLTALGCVMPIPGKRFRQVHFVDKQNSQTVKPQIQKFSALTYDTIHTIVGGI